MMRVDAIILGKYYLSGDGNMSRTVIIRQDREYDALK
jgi:hypothetical protein